MKIRKLVAATDVKAEEQLSNDCSISAQEDYAGAIDCIQNAINLLAHTLQCNKDDIVAKESLANLAVVLLDLKSAQTADVASVPDAIESEPVLEEDL